MIVKTGKNEIQLICDGKIKFNLPILFYRS